MVWIFKNLYSFVEFDLLDYTVFSLKIEMGLFYKHILKETLNPSETPPLTQIS